MALKGKKLTEEHKKKISEANTGFKVSEKTKEKLRKINLGKKASEETKQKMSKIAKEKGFGKWSKGKPSPHKGKKHSEGTKRKISEAKKGQIPWNKGKPFPAMIGNTNGFKKGQIPFNKGKRGLQVGWNKGTKGICKMNRTSFKKGLTPWNKGKKGFYHSGSFKKGHKQLNTGRTHLKGGNKHPDWQGGISFEPYTIDWTLTLKKSIRERDKYTCQICGKEPATHCHHIDYNKKNCDPKNLITLCDSCHTKTNHSRDYWKNYFQIGR